MKNMMLVTHGDFAKGILNSLNLVLGQVENVDYVSITAKETISELAFMLEQKMDGFGNSSPGVILTDIAGGSTTQAAMKLLDGGRRIYLITGLNLGLLLEIALLPLGEDEETDKVLLRTAIDHSRASMNLVNDWMEGQAEAGDVPGEL